MLLLVLFTIALALVFDFYNGMNDAANSVATVVSTRVLTPRQAVAWAAFWNFVAAFVFGTAVAKTIHGGVLNLQSVSLPAWGDIHKERAERLRQNSILIPIRLCIKIKVSVLPVSETVKS